MDYVVDALTVYNGELIAGGGFTTAGGYPCAFVARWAAPTGACCLLAGACQVLSPTECAAFAGTYHGNWTACDPNPCPPCVGDLNCDGVVDCGDINPFVMYLSNFAAWQTSYAGCNERNGDVNGDDLYPDFGDINPFVQLMVSSPLSCP